MVIKNENDYLVNSMYTNDDNRQRQVVVKWRIW
jgi:hypothetical protein